MSMKIGIYTPDSTLLNIAAMKISAYHKNRGDTVSLATELTPASEFDLTYASVLFPWTPDPPATYIGGPKYLYSVLPEKIDSLFPDYSLYPENTMSYGITYRLCPRRCWFCYNHSFSFPGRKVSFRIHEFHNPEFKTICILDPNFLANPEWEQRCDELNDTGAEIFFPNGFDARLVTQSVAKKLAKLNFEASSLPIFVAFDDPADQASVLRGLENFISAGLTALSSFVLISPRYSDQEDIRRVRELLARNIGVALTIHDPSDARKLALAERLVATYPGRVGIDKTTLVTTHRNSLPPIRSAGIPIPD